jgi:mono/diheme cytochrome c family protein
MKRRLAIVVATTCFIIAVAFNVRGSAQQSPAPAPAPPSQAVPEPQAPAQPTTGVAAEHRAVLSKYCFTCHNDRLKSGGLALSALDVANLSKDAGEWEKVVRKVRTGAMPPVGRPRPDKAVADNLVTWLETELDRTALENPNPGRPTLQRLNRAEYRNAIRDLLALEIDAPSMLPADAAGYGFDNNADALTLSPALTERYLGAAAKISQMALARPRGLPTPETFFVPTDRNQSIRVSDDLPFGSRGGLAVRSYFPADGEYLFELRPKESGVAGGFEGITAEPHQLEVRIDDVKIWTVTVGGPEFAPRRGADAGGGGGLDEQERNKKIIDLLTFHVPVKAGSHLVQAYFVAKTAAYVEDLFDPSLRREPYRAGGGETRISTLTITGPQTGTAAVGDTPSRRRILLCNPASGQDACAKKIISTLARRAYRRPVTDADLQAPLTSYRDGAGRSGFDAGIEMAVRSILVSPKFLFRFEDQPATAADNAPYRISDLDLASRLSFFLWSSVPDDQLLDVAEKKSLHQPEVLQQQVRRMLADSRSQALVDNFAGQWLFIRNVAVHQPSPEVLFHFDDNLRQAFEQETQLFFESIIRENRPVTDLLDADYTFLNERLAEHYGIPGVHGERFRRVSLPADSPRRGLLGKGSILMATSYANRTSPVVRGKWILENVFGAPPPPPPPNVPELKDERDPRKVLPMREQMAAHRANPVCAGCHAQMDQLGFALENFDGIGEWRDIYVSGARVDASAELPDGTKFNGPSELRQVLRQHSQEFLTTVSERLLTYALGRGLDASDNPAVRKIKRDAARDDYRFESLIQAIVTSTPFQMRTAQANTN